WHRRPSDERDRGSSRCSCRACPGARCRRRPRPGCLRRDRCKADTDRSTWSSWSCRPAWPPPLSRAARGSPASCGGTPTPDRPPGYDTRQAAVDWVGITALEEPPMSTIEAEREITQHEADQVERANAFGRTPVVFIHGLWLLPTSWDRWGDLFESAGYSAVKPGWPDDPETVADAKARPQVFAGKSVGHVADYVSGIVKRLHKKPAVVGHSFGGLLAQIVAGRGLSAATVAIDPAPFRGVLPLPFSAVKAASPVLSNPANRNKAVPLTYEQFRFAF